ncbi:glycine cleavage system aminomethyltransferase GcvT [Candidatus Woesearchaeota archaeon]|nr:glycine cleavage system aminomethyltransferase GcvT [Candidatus Woesearchaeota archaeon]
MKTILYEEHKKLGASIVDFNGWEMPLQYGSIIREHHNTRKKASLFDTSHMGEIIIEGKDALEFLQKITAKDISKIKEKGCSYTVMCNKKGGTIDDLFIYRLNENKFMLVVNAGNIEKDLKHLVANRNALNTTISNASKNTSKLDLQGPLSQNILEKAFKISLKQLKRFEFTEKIIGQTYFIISRSGYTGEDGFEIYFEAGKAKELWKLLLESGREHNLKPAGLGARDTLRLESCYSLYGHELSEEISPIEAGIPFTISFGKENFIGKQRLKEIKKNQKKKIAAFIMTGKAIPRKGYKVLKSDKGIGYVTSGTLSPSLKKGIGLALVDANYAETEIDINIRNKLHPAKIVKKPFYKRGW